MTSTLKWLVASVAGILVGFGLCGLDRLVHPHSVGINGDVLPLLGFGLCLFSALSVVAALVTLLVQVILKGFERRS